MGGFGGSEGVLGFGGVNPWLEGSGKTEKGVEPPFWGAGGPEKRAETWEKAGFGSEGGLAGPLGAEKAGLTGVRPLPVVEGPEKKVLEGVGDRDGP